MKTTTSVLLALALMFCLGFTTAVTVVQPAQPKEVAVNICVDASEVRSVILSQHYKGWITKSVTYTSDLRIVVVMEKY